MSSKSISTTLSLGVRCAPSCYFHGHWPQDCLKTTYAVSTDAELHAPPFLSNNITGANSRHIEAKFLLPPSNISPPLSTYQFAEERPNTDNWGFWAEFWGQYTIAGHYFETSLGKWTVPTHRKWRWFYGSASDVIEHQVDNGVEYFAAIGSCRIRLQCTYSRVLNG